jgi:hypothetical protein
VSFEGWNLGKHSLVPYWPGKLKGSRAAGPPPMNLAYCLLALYGCFFPPPSLKKKKEKEKTLKKKK